MILLYTQNNQKSGVVSQTKTWSRYSSRNVS